MIRHLTAENAARVERKLANALSSARSFAAGEDSLDLVAALDVMTECRFFTIGMAQASTEADRHGYRCRLLNFLGDASCDVSRQQYADLWDCLDEAGVSRAEARGLGEAP